MKGSKGYARQRHEPAHIKNAVQEPEEIRVFVLRYNLAHNVRNAFPRNAIDAAANGNVDTGLDAYTPGFDANTRLFQGKVGKGEGLSVKRRGKVVTASSSKLHLDNLFFDLCEPVEIIYSHRFTLSSNFFYRIKETLSSLHWLFPL